MHGMGTMQFMPYWIVDYNKNYPKHILKTNDFLEIYHYVSIDII